jgi:hypothetical protein
VNVARHFEDWLQAYMDFTELSEAPASFHFCTGVSTLAGAIRRRVWIDELWYHYTPNFYIVLVGPPGVVTKSTSIGIGMSLLANVPGVQFGPPSMTWQFMNEALNNATEAVEIGHNKVVSMSAITIAAAELGTFLRPENGEFMDVLTHLWDGVPWDAQPWARGTKGEGEIKIKNPWINIIGATTPSWLKMNIPEHMIGGGLASRILFVYGDQKRHLVAYPSDLILGKQHHELRAKLIEDLIRISKLKGEYKLAPAARQWGKEWYENLQNTRPLHLADERYSGYLARKQTLLHKLALVLTLARRDEPLVGVLEMQQADTFLQGVEGDMAKVFESIGLVDSAVKLNTILQFLRTYKRMSNKDLWTRCIPYMDQKTYSEAILAGVKADLIAVGQHEGEAVIMLKPQGELQ